MFHSIYNSVLYRTIELFLKDAICNVFESVFGHIIVKLNFSKYTHVICNLKRLEINMDHFFISGLRLQFSGPEISPALAEKELLSHVSLSENCNLANILHFSLKQRDLKITNCSLKVTSGCIKHAFMKIFFQRYY